MATEFWVRDSSTWRKAKQVWFRDATDWRKAKQVWVHDGTAFRKVYQGFELAFNGTQNVNCYVDAQLDSEFGQDDSSAEVLLWVYTDGTYQQYGASSPYGGLDLNTTGSWGTPSMAGIGSSYHARLRKVSGDNPNRSGTLSLDTWYPITSTLEWGWSRTGATTAWCGYYLDISWDGGSNYVSSAYCAAQITWTDIA